MFAKIRFYISGLTILFNTAVLMIPTMILFKEKKSTIIHHINRLTLFLIGGRLQQHGEMDKEAELFVMNHQSIVDIIGMEALQNSHLRWVAKKELFELPWLGYLLKYGEMISLDRSNKAGIRKLMKDIKESYDVYDRPVAIFPEGTRCQDQQMLPFKPGTYIVASQLRLKVQPVVITGSKHILNIKTKTAHSGTIHYHFLPTIDLADVEGKSWFDTLQHDMQKVIDAEHNDHHRSR